MAQAKTIQIFLPDGNPRGVRLVDITSRTVQLLEVPRALLAAAAKREELNNVGVYFLFGTDDATGTALVYVGEAENCLVRLRQHDGPRGKDFWKTAVVAVSKTQYFTKAHVKYLEWFCYEAIAQAQRFKLTNTTVPSRPHINESVAADLDDNFDSLRTLISTLGFPVFDELTARRSHDVLTIAGRNADARGEWTEDGLVVFEGSIASASETKSAEGTWVTSIRRKLRDSGVLVAENDQLKFATSYVFSSPSAAAVAVLGRNANGWTSWKFSDGRALDTLRQDRAGQRTQPATDGDPASDGRCSDV